MLESSHSSFSTTNKHPIDVLAESQVTEERIRAYWQLDDPNRLIGQDRQFALDELTRGIQEEYSPLARMAAAGALGSYPKPEAISALRSASADHDPNVRQEAIKSLGKIGTTSTIELLGKISHSDTASDVRLAAIEALSMTQDPGALTYLLAGLNDDDLLVSRASVLGLRIHTSKNFGDSYEAWAACLKDEKIRKAIASRSNSNISR